MGPSWELDYFRGSLQQVSAPKAGVMGVSPPPPCTTQPGVRAWDSGGHTLTSVDNDVLRQIPHVHEGLTTHATLVGANIIMVADMIGQLAGLDESAGPEGGACTEPPRLRRG